LIRCFCFWLIFRQDLTRGFSVDNKCHYPLNEAIAIIHVRCRCYLIPIKAEWIADGLIDLAWMRSHHDQTVAIANSPLNSGLAQFERSRGLTRPATPVWTPNGGFQDADFARAAGH
jgi:hypothetical protein